MICPYNVKVCTKCKKILIAHKINFNKGSNRSKYGLSSICRECDRERQIKYKENKRIWKEKNPNYDKQYYQDNKEEKLQKANNYYYENRENILEKRKLYRETHKEEISERQKSYHKNNPQTSINQNNKRRQREENQGGGISKEQWLEMMIFFEWCCAYSGEYIGGNSEHRTIDHIISLSKGGLNEIWNCIPCYDIYNYNKHTKEMEEWYKCQSYFLEKRLNKIYEWIEYAYNKWGRL